MDVESIISQLKKDEGFSPTPYWDNDQYTWGYGTKAPGAQGLITKEDAEVLLRGRVYLSIEEYKELFGNLVIDPVRAEALVNMLFNLGKVKFCKFKKMLGAIYREEWGTAAYEAFNSLWFKQLRKEGLQSIERSERIVWELLTGERG